MGFNGASRSCTLFLVAVCDAHKDFISVYNLIYACMVQRRVHGKWSSLKSEFLNYMQYILRLASFILKYRQTKYCNQLKYFVSFSWSIWSVHIVLTNYKCPSYIIIVISAVGHYLIAKQFFLMQLCTLFQNLHFNNAVYHLFLLITSV